MDLTQKIKTIPLGYSIVNYQNKKYGLSRKDFNGGKSIKVFAEELGGNNFISFNYYFTSISNLLKPCEMPIEKVLDFLENFTQSKMEV